VGPTIGVNVNVAAEGSSPVGDIKVSLNHGKEGTEVSAILSRGLTVGDWRSGEALWLIDFVAPFGGAASILSDVRKKRFPNEVINRLTPDPTTGGFVSKTWAPSKEDDNAPDPNTVN
jgi:hypothetical protein